MYWHRMRALNKKGENVGLLVCATGAFIVYVDNVASEQITQGGKMTKV